MENLCYKCKQEECPRCIKKAEERRKRHKEHLEWIGSIVTGLILYGVARAAYYIGKVNGRFEKGVEIEVQRRLKEMQIEDQEEDS